MVRWNLALHKANQICKVLWDARFHNSWILGLNVFFKASGDAIGGIASATGAAYNWIKNQFGNEKAKEALPKIEKAAEDAARSRRNVSKDEEIPEELFCLIFL